MIADTHTLYRRSERRRRRRRRHRREFTQVSRARTLTRSHDNDMCTHT